LFVFRPITPAIASNGELALVGAGIELYTYPSHYGGGLAFWVFFYPHGAAVPCKPADIPDPGCRYVSRRRFWGYAQGPRFGASPCHLWDGLRVLRYYGPRVPSPVRALRPIRGYRVPPSALQPPLEPVYAPTAILSTLPRT